MSPTSTLSSWEPDALTPAQLAAVSYLARYSGPTHALYAYQLRRWFDWCESNGLDPLTGVQRAHVELYIRGLAESGLRDSSICTMMHGVRGFFRFAHIDGLIAADPAVYVRLPKVHAAITNALDAGVRWRRPDPRPARRLWHHRALRPGPRQPRPIRLPLPNRLRRRHIDQTLVHAAASDPPKMSALLARSRESRSSWLPDEC